MSHSNERSRKRPGRGLALAGVVLAAFLACSESEPETEAAPSGTAAPTQPAPDESVIGDVERGEGGTLPKDFPADLPLPPGSSATRWMAASGPGSLVVFEADAAPDAVFEHFQTQLPGAGWKIDVQTTGSEHWTLVASKDRRTARISIAPSASGAQFGIAVATTH